MEWVRCTAHNHGQYMLEHLCSRVSFDVGQFNRLPESRRWHRLGCVNFRLKRHDVRRLATVEKMYGLPSEIGEESWNTACQFTAHEQDVEILYPHNHWPSMKLTALPIDAENRWSIESDGDELSKSPIWEVSQLILKRLFFP